MVHFRYIDEYLLCKKHAVEVKCGSEAARFHEITVRLAEGPRIALVECGRLSIVWKRVVVLHVTARQKCAGR